MDRKIVFFFGAGAEQGKHSFDLPSGSDYTLKTMQQKHNKLYKELRTFYSLRLSEDYAKEYKNAFLFEKGSHTFRKIIYRAALECIRDNVNDQDLNPYKRYIELVREHENLIKNGKYDDQKAKDIREEIKEAAKDVYDLLVEDKDTDNPKNEILSAEKTKEFKDYLLFYGAVEKDFSAIVEPNRIGLTQFWRVINYFWSAFFTILEPICREFSWYNSANDDKRAFYNYTLNNLSSVIRQVYNDYNYINADQRNGNYYKAIADKYPNSTALTTNYTPFIEHYFNKSVYLAGKLKEFEFPESLTVKDISHEPIDENSFLFPFLMTQAPIKPIVSPSQIHEYKKAIDELQKATDIIVIGYSLGQADNHINAILRECVLDRNKRIYYCYYTESDIDSDNIEKEKVLNSLRIHDRLPNLYMIQNRGNAKELLAKLDEQLIGRM